MSPRIYVASLTDYNHLEYHGAWIDADQDPEDIHEEVQAMLKESPMAQRYGEVAEEWAIHDYEGFFGVEISEHDSFERVSKIARLLAGERPAVAAYFIGEGYDLDQIPDLVSERCVHESEEHSDLKAVAEHHYEDLEARDDIPKDIKDSYLGALSEAMAESDLNGGVYFTIQYKHDYRCTTYVMSHH